MIIGITKSTKQGKSQPVLNTYVILTWQRYEPEIYVKDDVRDDNDLQSAFGGIDTIEPSISLLKKMGVVESKNKKV